MTSRVVELRGGPTDGLVLQVREGPAWVDVAVECPCSLLLCPGRRVAVGEPVSHQPVEETSGRWLELMNRLGFGGQL